MKENMITKFYREGLLECDHLGDLEEGVMIISKRLRKKA
jgi:hypothetical protein